MSRPTADEMPEIEGDLDCPCCRADLAAWQELLREKIGKDTPQVLVCDLLLYPIRFRSQGDVLSFGPEAFAIVMEYVESQGVDVAAAMRAGAALN